MSRISDDAAHELPFAGVKILDLSRHLPGPWCTQYLGDLGAEIIKLEHLGVGDPSRYNPPVYNRDSVYFHSVNSGKRSIALDLSHKLAGPVKERLLKQADIVVARRTVAKYRDNLRIPSSVDRRRQKMTPARAVVHSVDQLNA